MKSKKILSLLLVLCMLVFAVPFSAGAAETKDIADTLVEALGVPAAAAEAVVEGQPVPENFAASVAYVSDYASLKAAVENPAVTIVVILNDIILEDTLTVSVDKMNLALIAMSEVTLYSADQNWHFLVEQPYDQAWLTNLVFSNVILDGNGTGGGIYALRDVNESVLLHIDGLIVQNCDIVNRNVDTVITVTRLSIVDSEIRSNSISGICALTLSMENTTVKNNLGTGIKSDEYYLSSLSIVDSDISQNGQYGILLEAFLNKVYIDNCSVNANGMTGIRIDSSSGNNFTPGSGIYNCEVRGNGTSGNAEQGGGIYIFTEPGSSFGVDNCTIDGNMAWDGGGIYVSHTQFHLVDCDIMNNSAERGAGVFYENLIEGSSAGTKIYNNMAEFEGGGVYFYNPYGWKIANWIEAEIYNNESGYNGGGIYVDANLAVAILGDVHGNVARTRGGGVYVADSSSIEVIGSIYDNSARQGADIWPIQ